MKVKDCTKAQVALMVEAVGEMYEAIPKRRRGEFLGHLNEVSLFLEAARREAKA